MKSRNILFITTDQQRFDSLGVTGCRWARTPVIDCLASTGLLYLHAHVHNVVCMPSRSTMLTGQHPLTHGVTANGIPLPEDAPSVAHWLRKRAGYRTALIGKAHFEPHLDLSLHYFENRCASEGSSGPWRGFDHIELATHGPMGGHHYAQWLWKHHPDYISGFAGVLSGDGGGDTSAPEVAHNPIPRSMYHTDWVADRTLAWLRSVPNDEPFFCWMSFPDPHHPFDPPYEEVKERIDWRDIPLPDGYPTSAPQREKILGNKPQHWLAWYQGKFRNPEGGPTMFVPGQLTENQIREMNAMIHVENELIDEACGRVIDYLCEQGIDEHTDIFFTSDHGELQGDFGLMFKGPYHVESLLRIPMVWRPAPASATLPAIVPEPVGHVDLAPTFCAIAGVEQPEWMQGSPLPTKAGSGRDHVITTFDSQFANVGMHLRTIYRDGYLCTVYQPRTYEQGGKFRFYWPIWNRGGLIPDYTGAEGELYNCHEDPHQWENRWSDPTMQSLKKELIAQLYESMPPARHPPLRVEAPT
jgi:arylsulfatase A-like enzyme